MKIVVNHSHDRLHANAELFAVKPKFYKIINFILLFSLRESKCYIMPLNLLEVNDF